MEENTEVEYYEYYEQDEEGNLTLVQKVEKSVFDIS